MLHIDSYLNFNGNTREAMEFYSKCLNGELEIQTIGESPMAANVPSEFHNNILHSSLTVDGKVFLMAADTMNHAPSINGTSVNLCLSGDLDDVKRVFQNLSEGGQITQPLTVEFFGTFGSLIDKYGISWLFQSDAKA